MKKWKRHPAPDLDELEIQAEAEHHFAIGQGFYKMFWVFFIGSFAGILVETLWHLLRYGEFQYCGKGLVYGPFNLVYGIGALVLALSLTWLKDKRDIVIMLGGVLIGSAVEYVCSLVQELCFGSNSWNYSQVPFNLHGRINLLYSLLWGVLAIVWVKDIYPFLVELIFKIPSKIGKPLTWVLAVFMVVNTAVSGLAVERWSERVEGRAEPQNTVGAFFDEHFPDERMKKIYPGMKFLVPEK